MNATLIDCLRFALIGSASVLIFLCVHQLGQYFSSNNVSLDGDKQ